MPTYDVQIEQAANTRTWRGRFFEAAANASVKVVEYSLRHQDSTNAAIWMERLQFFREKARLCS